MFTMMRIGFALTENAKKVSEVRMNDGIIKEGIYMEIKFSFPNNGNRHELIKEELIKLLEYVYDCGYTDALAHSEDTEENNSWFNSQFIEGEH